MLRNNESSVAQRAMVSAALSVLFLVVYGGSMWITMRRAQVGSFFWEWERVIPFVPWLIVPYLSIDLFFVAAPFFCREREELRVFAQRIAAAILVAGLCFLLFPLRFAFARPAVSGWNGLLVDWFRAMDAPFNLAPSLHAALLLLLWDVYARRLRGGARVVVLAWFVLIGFSPVLIYQHHLIDIVTGSALAIYCFYFFRPTMARLPVTKNFRIGGYYAGAAAVLTALTIFSWPHGALLVWPLGAVAIVASAYFGFGPGIFRKTNGVIPWSARLVLGPCLIGQYLSLQYYARKCRRWDAITPHLWVGRLLREREAREAIAAGATAVLDLSAEFSETAAFRGLRYRNIPILDLTAPTCAQLDEAAEFIVAESARGIVYVHCKIGYSRSAAIATAALLALGEVDSADEAIARLRAARPGIIIRPEVRAALVRFSPRFARHRDLPIETAP